jgi:hypothetical protein
MPKTPEQSDDRDPKTLHETMQELLESGRLEADVDPEVAAAEDNPYMPPERPDLSELDLNQQRSILEVNVRSGRLFIESDEDDPLATESVKELHRVRLGQAEEALADFKQKHPEMFTDKDETGQP